MKKIVHYRMAGASVTACNITWKTDMHSTRRLADVTCDSCLMALIKEAMS